VAEAMPERLTIDQTVAIDLLDPDAERSAQAIELLDLFRRGEIELAVAPQGYRLERRGDLTEQIREAFDREGMVQARQVARVSEVTFPGEDLFPGHYVEGFAEACEQIAADWPKAPGSADRFHVETHMAEGRDVFVTDDRRLLVLCRRLREEPASRSWR
jgi:hypothetical protein